MDPSEGKVGLSETWIYVNVALMAHHYTVFCYDPFTLKLTLNALCSELEECEKVGRRCFSSPRYKGGVITPNLHTALLLRLQDTPQLNSQDTQGIKWSLYG